MRCIGCRCTEYRACLGGCSWLSVNPPKCSACIEAGILSLKHDSFISFPASQPRRDEARLMLTGTGRRLQCLG